MRAFVLRIERAITSAVTRTTNAPMQISALIARNSNPALCICHLPTETSAGSTSRPSRITKNPRANGESTVRRRTSSQSTCSRTARASPIRPEKSALCSSRAVSLLWSTSSSAITRTSMASTCSVRPRSMTSSFTSSPRGSKIRSTTMSPSQAFSSHPSGGRSGRIPAASSAPRARSASSGLIKKSRSLRFSGPPCAHTARLPASRNGISASRRAATQRFMLATMSSNECSASVTPDGYPLSRFSIPQLAGRQPPVSDAAGQRDCVRVAAAGDIHIREANAGDVKEAFQAIAPKADLILLAGDLTTHGEPGQAGFLAKACEGIAIPVVAVLGNHDYHCARAGELAAALAEAGIVVLDRESQVFDVEGIEVGIVGAKGFVGGFAGSHLPDFGEPLLRQVYRETSDEVDGIAQGLVAVAHCPLRIVLLHYAPIEATI